MTSADLEYSDLGQQIKGPPHPSFRTNPVKNTLMSKSNVLKILDSIAPLSIAESWDNVGLLVDSLSQNVSKIMLTVDLTDGVVDECIRNKTDFVIAYHPVIFKPIKRIGLEENRNILKCIANGISVYCPHSVSVSTCSFQT